MASEFIPGLTSKLENVPISKVLSSPQYLNFGESQERQDADLKGLWHPGTY